MKPTPAPLQGGEDVYLVVVSGCPRTARSNKFRSTLLRVFDISKL
jgi:hypothetical protein